MTRYAQTIYLPLKCHILRETDKALQVRIPNHPTNEWLPISQCAQILRANPEDVEAFSILMVAEWILKDKEIKSTPLTEEEIKNNMQVLFNKPKEPSKLYGDRTGLSSAKPLDDEVPF